MTRLEETFKRFGRKQAGPHYILKSLTGKPTVIPVLNNGTSIVLRMKLAQPKLVTNKADCGNASKRLGRKQAGPHYILKPLRGNLRLFQYASKDISSAENGHLQASGLHITN